MKGVWAAYVVALLIIGAATWGYYTYLEDKPRWFLAIPLVFLYPVFKKHILQRAAKLTIQGDHLTLDAGLLSKSRRTLDMAKVQDVTVRQTMGQRMIGIGDLILETAGDRSGSLTMLGIDRPRAIADEILEASHRAARARTQGGV
jgi:uncharacterized membrane protein YdbT with pleckstrin-like domain